MLSNLDRAAYHIQQVAWALHSTAWQKTARTLARMPRPSFETLDQDFDLEEEPEARDVPELPSAEKGLLRRYLGTLKTAGARSDVARGVSWAAQTLGTSMIIPDVLEDLLLDNDPAVRMDAAIALGFLGTNEGSWHVGAALSLPDDMLGRVVSPEQRHYLVGLPKDFPQRARLWAAYQACHRGDYLDWRPRLGPGRLREVGRDMRRAADRP